MNTTKRVILVLTLLCTLTTCGNPESPIEIHYPEAIDHAYTSHTIDLASGLIVTLYVFDDIGVNQKAARDMLEYFQFIAITTESLSYSFTSPADIVYGEHMTVMVSPRMVTEVALFVVPETIDMPSWSKQKSTRGITAIWHNGVVTAVIRIGDEKRSPSDEPNNTFAIEACQVFVEVRTDPEEHSFVG